MISMCGMNVGMDEWTTCLTKCFYLVLTIWINFHKYLKLSSKVVTKVMGKIFGNACWCLFLYWVNIKVERIMKKLQTLRRFIMEVFKQRFLQWTTEYHCSYFSKHFPMIHLSIFSSNSSSVNPSYLWCISK